MAVYKIFPTKDASIYSYYPTKNAGLDEILDISLYESIESTGEVSRALLAFSNTEITDILSNKIGSSNYKAYLKLYLANASEIPLDYTLYCHPISSSWDMGIGRAANVPSTTNGVSWKYKKHNKWEYIYFISCKMLLMLIMDLILEVEVGGLEVI